MKNTSIHKAAMLGSASALGLNWIYDKDLLIEHKKSGQKMIFESIDHNLYKQAKKSYNVYPNHHVGDLDFMGEVYYLFYMFIEYEDDLTIERWRDNFYSYFRSDYEYDGYIESFGTAFLEQYEQELQGRSKPSTSTDHIDKQLVGLLFILATYSSYNSFDKLDDALRFANTLTAYDGIPQLHKLLLELLTKLDHETDIQTALSSVIQYAPDEYKKSLQASLQDMDVYDFIEQYSGVACGINQALPLIFYIVNNATSWQDGMIMNATLGGASSARGIFVSAILSRIFDIPIQYQDLLNYHVK